jgi:hypothetical protein
LYVIDAKTEKIEKQFGLDGEAYMSVMSLDAKDLYISCWGCDQVLVFDLEKQAWKSPIRVGDNPNEMILDGKSNRIFVSCGNDNSVHVISTVSKKVTEILNTALFQLSPTGSTPNGLDIDNKTGVLFVANADNNNLALFDIRKIDETKGMGFVPTGWYPTQVKVISNQVFVANGKGLVSLANPNGPNPVRIKNSAEYQKGIKKSPVQYIGGLFKGTLSIFKEPTLTELTSLTKQVYLNTPYNKNKELSTSGMKGNPIPKNVGDSSPIKHVFYMIKENRTYDQVLSDLPQGNGDSSLLLFGRTITVSFEETATILDTVTALLSATKKFGFPNSPNKSTTGFPFKATILSPVINPT